MPSRRESGRATGSALLLLVLLSGLGAWNYHRNWTIEKQTEGLRPYESYSASDLTALRDAYQGELNGVEAQFDAAKRQRIRPQGDRGSIAGNVDQFAQTAANSKRIRAAAANVSEQRGEIAELERELELRSRLGEGAMRHVKRLTSI